MNRVFFSVSYLKRLPIVVQLLHSVQALPDSSDKLGLVSVTFQTKRCQTGLASAKKNGWQNKLRDRSTSPKLRKTVSLLILQSTFSRTVISLSKQKRTNAHGHNFTTSYFGDVMSGAFYS